MTHVMGDYVEHHVKIVNNYIHGYQKNGITVNEPGASANVVGNKVVGAGKTDVIAQNGIQLGVGATERSRAKALPVTGNCQKPDFEGLSN